jgi:hypothetical protein
MVMVVPGVMAAGVVMAMSCKRSSTN